MEPSGDAKPAVVPRFWGDFADIMILVLSNIENHTGIKADFGAEGFPIFADEMERTSIVWLPVGG